MIIALMASLILDKKSYYNNIAFVNVFCQNILVCSHLKDNYYVFYPNLVLSETDVHCHYKHTSTLNSK